jgi:hypothetical protein|tara:strand:- start:706 stop:1155 length:450 start_codon:yes stop_codon:yes gene_type:complete
MKKSEQRLLLLLGAVVVGYVAMTFTGKSTKTPAITKAQNKVVAEADPMTIINSINQQVPEIPLDTIETNPAWGHDIFSIQNTGAAKEEPTTTIYKLTGIMRSTKQNKAIINGKLYAKGMMIDGYLISAIENESVILSKRNESITLKMGK